MPLIMHGSWTVSVKAKNAAFAQRFIISGASSGTGTYVAPHAPVNVTGGTWSLRIQSNPAGSTWADSEYQITYPSVSGGQYQFDLESNDVWVGDHDFNDLVLTLSTPVSETDFLVYGHVSTYDGCWHNPCYPWSIVIESRRALALAERYPLVKKALDDVYREPPVVRLPLGGDPPRDMPAALLGGVVFKPRFLPLQGESGVPVKKAQIFKKIAAGRKAAERKEVINNAPMTMRTVNLAEPAARSVMTIDQAALSKLVAVSAKTCSVDPLINASLRFIEYDRTEAEKTGAAFSGEGNRETLGLATTDRNGNYVFRFHKTLSELIGESNLDVAVGEDEVLQAMPDLIVQVLGSSLPGGGLYETPPYWNVPLLKQISICIPSQNWDTPTISDCHGRPISHIGFIPVGKPSTVTLDSDGRVTCTDTSKIDIPQTRCAAWWGALRMSACLGKYDKVPHFTLEHRARRPDGVWTAWQTYQEELKLDQWNSTLGEWVANKVGPYTHTLEFVKSQPHEDVFAYNNVQGNMDWSGPDWFIKAIIPSWVYSYLGGPGSVEFRLKGYDTDGKQVGWIDPSDGLTKYSDTIRLYIDHTGPELDFKEISIGAPTTNPCPLFTLTAPELVTATLNVKFKAVQRQGFLSSYTLYLTKCNSGEFSVQDTPGAHPLGQTYAFSSATACNEMHGTEFGYDTAADTDDYVAMHLNPPGSTPWLEAGETLSIFTLNLTAAVRRTDGHSSYPGYGPMQYNLVVQKAP